jgi:hypothetical protein
MDRCQRFKRGSLGAGQVTTGFQVVGEAARLVERPRLKRGHELALVNDTRL